MSVGDHVFMFNFNRFWKMHSILYLDSYTASFAISVASTSSLFVLLRGHGDNMAIFVCPKFHSLETQKEEKKIHSSVQRNQGDHQACLQLPFLMLID
jgi:hypothetical protein